MDSYRNNDDSNDDFNSDESIFSIPKDTKDDHEKKLSTSSKLKRKKIADLESLPSPRAQHELAIVEDETPKKVDEEAHKEHTSISELNPFFEELDDASLRNSSEDESPENSASREPETCYNHKMQRSQKTRRTSPTGRILITAIEGSSAASTANRQESASSFFEQPEWDKGKANLRKKLKNVSTRVKKQLGFPSGYIEDRCTALTARIVTGNKMHGFEEDSFASGDAQPPSVNSCKKGSSDQEKILKDYYRSKGGMANPFENLDDFRDDNNTAYSCTLLWSLPNWVENDMTSKREPNILEELIEDAKERIAQEHPMEWAETVNYLRKSVGRDFRRGYLALGEKMQLPNLQAIRCLKFNPIHSFLAIGCEHGLLIVLELNYEIPVQNYLQPAKSDRSFQNLLYNLPIGSKCRVQMNESLVGHSYDLRCLAWNNLNGKLISSDELGVIIGWSFGEAGCWVEEIINDRSTSLIRDIAWSPDGTKIAIGYEDYTEDGSITGGLLVGNADGVHIFDRKFPDSQVNCVVWYSDDMIWTVVNCILYVFDREGKAGALYRQLSRNKESDDITSFLLRPETSWVKSENAPKFAVVFKDSCVMLFKGIEDKNPVQVQTNLTTNCADWCANGLYIAIGGMSLVVGVTQSSPRINLYNSLGNLLQIVKIPGSTISNVCWDHDSLHLAVSTERSIYFANLRPMYKVSSNGKVHCYAYTTDGATQLVNFWKGQSRFTQNIPGKVIDIKSCDDKFALLCMDSMGVYHIFVFGETGVHHHHLCITTMEPFAITMTKRSIVCLAPNAILNWNYNLGTSSPDTRKFIGAVKKTRQIHVDDYPAIIEKPGERSNHLTRPTMNSARCMHALKDQLCIARESGRLQLYALPTLGYLQAYQLNLSDGDICQQLSFNHDGTRLALLTMNGHLKIFLFLTAPGKGTEILNCVNCNNISSLLWATDMPNFLCVLEGDDIHIIKEDEKIETISKVPPGSYMTKFEALEITLIDMEQVIENTDQPFSNMILKVQVPTLAKLENDLINQEPIEDILLVLDNTCYNHTLLRKLIAEEALRQGEHTLAEHIYSYDQNFMAIQFLERVRDLEPQELKKAETLCFLEDYEQAQHYFVRAERKDLAIKMWKDLGDWDKVRFLSSSYFDDSNGEAIASEFEECVECEDWESAYKLALKSGNAEEVMRCCIMLEDHDKLIDLSERLSLRDPLLKKIGEILASDGVTEQAANCFLQYGDPLSAMSVAVDTRYWDLAMSLSYQHQLPLITPSLVVHVKSLIAANNLNPAIQILERCGKITTAGKLLVWKGLCMLQNEKANTTEIKKIFVLAAHTLSKWKGRVKRTSQTKLTDSEELDLEFLIPEKQLRIMSGHNEWCWTDPWRGAEAIHFLNLCQKSIHRDRTSRAFVAAMHLKTFEDILGSERVNSLVALTAIKEGNLRTASNALLKLEAVDEGYSSISFNLFKSQSPEDLNVNIVQCQGCEKSFPDFLSACPNCKAKLFICLYCALPIVREKEVWTCKVCSRHVDVTKLDRMKYCLLCHSEIKQLDCS